MARSSLLLAAAAAALLVLPVALAQAPSGAPLVFVFYDEFNGSDANGWRTASTSTTPDDDWFRVQDGTGTEARGVWFASRTTSQNAADGYRNGDSVELMSPDISIPAGIEPRSFAFTLRGSSEQDFDTLTLEWATSSTAVQGDWETLAVLSGSDREDSYSFFELSSTKLLSHVGDNVVVRLRFQADPDSCDSMPEPAPAPLPDPVPDPGTPVTSPGEPCGGIGWFVDNVGFIGRRDFAASAAPDAPRLPLDAAGPDRSVDLLGDRGKLVAFRLDPATVPVPAGTESLLVSLDRRNSADALNLAASRGTDGVWTALLAVDEPDFIAGTWDVDFFAGHDAGTTRVALRILTASAQDQAVPQITVLPTGSPVRLGPGSVLTVDVQEALLRRVTYSYPGLPTPLEMPFPYVLPVAALPEGPTLLTVKAEDRTGHQAQVDVTVDRDTLRPLLSLAGPAITYAGVPFDLTLNIVERSAHTIRVDANGTEVPAILVAAGMAGSGRATVLQITPPEVGNLTVQVVVNDTIGNQAFELRQFKVVEPVTDLRVNAVRLATPATNIAREGHGIVAVIEQVGGVAALPVTVTFEAAGRSQAYTVTVPASGPFEVRWDTSLPPGMHEVTVHAQAPETANETLPGNENGSLAVESFLGRITIGTKVYNVRSDARSLPASVVLAGSSKTYPLTLVESGKGVAYEFTVEGNRTIVWDPLDPVMVIPASSSSTTGSDKDAPFPGLILSLLVVALAAFLQRRRARNGR